MLTKDQVKQEAEKSVTPHDETIAPLRMGRIDRLWYILYLDTTRYRGDEPFWIAYSEKANMLDVERIRFRDRDEAEDYLDLMLEVYKSGGKL